MPESTILNNNSQLALTHLRTRTSSTEQTPLQATSGAPFTFTSTPRHTATKAKRYATANGITEKNQQQAWFELRVPKKGITVTARAATVGHQELVEKTRPSSNLHYYSPL
jgi:hypothetical protein